MRWQICLLLLMVLGNALASAQHCRKVDIDKSSGYCTVPDPKITPGEMDAALACSPAGHLRQVSQSTRALILAAYGLPTNIDESSGEFDHFFPEWMGGTDGPKNIWFEPHAGRFGSYAKDKVEKDLYQKVCIDHTMTVGDARRVFLGGWTKYYLKLTAPQD